jgi:DNA-binding response OmpR family regulator
MNSDLILLVDDETNIVQLVRLYLERDGFQVQAAGDGLDALKAIDTFHPALVVLDIMLPGLDGMEIVRRLRSDHNNVPVMMLTARDEDIDKILGLELGADDYMTKPFNPRELVARVKAILRRSESQVPNVAAVEVVHVGDLVIDTARREVSSGGRMIDLRTQEFEVLLVLARHKGLVLTREQLLSLAWGFDFYGQTRTVDVHIAQIRRKLDGSRVTIETVSGIGYKLVG